LFNAWGKVRLGANLASLYFNAVFQYEDCLSRVNEIYILSDIYKALIASMTATKARATSGNFEAIHEGYLTLCHMSYLNARGWHCFSELYNMMEYNAQKAFLGFYKTKDISEMKATFVDIFNSNTRILDGFYPDLEHYRKDPINVPPSKEVAQTYLEILEKERNDILSGMYSPTDGIVVIANIFGDNLPELMYVKTIESGYYDSEERKNARDEYLYIWTIINNEPSLVSKIFFNSYFIGGPHQGFFMTKLNELWCYEYDYSGGMIDSFKRFELKGNQLQIVDEYLFSPYHGSENDDTFAHGDDERYCEKCFTHNGKVFDSKDFVSIINALYKNYSLFLLSNYEKQIWGYSTESLKETTWSEDTILDIPSASKTYIQAINYLNGYK